MKSGDLRPEDMDWADSMLRRIYREAPDRYRDASEAHCVVTAKRFEGKGNIGILAILRFEDFIVSYVSFESDPDGPTISAIGKQIKDAGEESGREFRFVNINGQNAKIIRHFEKGPYLKDRESVEYVYSGKKKSRKKLAGGLERRDFDEECFEDYIWLLDTSLRQLLIKDGRMLDPYRRNLKRSYSVLTEAAESGEFGSYWKGDSIVGLYLLRGNLILDMVVNPVYQNQGIGAGILDDMLAKLMKSHKEAMLYVSKNNEGAMRFYERAGFVRTASNADFTFSPPKECA